MSGLRCGVVIYDPKAGVRTCGAKVTHNLIFRGDYLFGVCHRHNARIERAIPDLVDKVGLLT